MKFAIIGAAAYIAPRHMQAIVDTGNELVAALDPYDNVGILDRYAPNCQYFREFERFDRYVDKCRRKGDPIDWLVVCSPNYLHDSHIRFGLRSGLDVLCEKPLVLTPWNLDGLDELENETGKRVYTVLQLRHHEAVKRLYYEQHFAAVSQDYDPGHRHEVCLTYMTPRGPWFNRSWKGSDDLAGGIIANIGIHFLDLLIWCFGDVEQVRIHYADPRRITGHLKLERADVKWYLSTAFEDVERFGREDNGDNGAVRHLTVDHKEIDLTHNFRDLHTVVYEQTLAGQGHTVRDARPSIELSYTIQQRKDTPSWPDADFYSTAHPLATKFTR